MVGVSYQRVLVCLTEGYSQTWRTRIFGSSKVPQQINKANGTKYSRIDYVKFVEDSLCSGRPYHFKFFNGCLPQILLGPFLNTLSQIIFANKGEVSSNASDYN